VSAFVIQNKYRALFGYAIIFLAYNEKRGLMLMMRVYICPDCGWMRMVSRRKNVECYKCGVQDMTLAKVDFATYVSWSEKERQEYASAWMYIHNKGKIKRN
jgi:hypothetical protein